MEPKFKIGDVVKCHVPEDFKNSRWCDSFTASCDELVGVVTEVFNFPPVTEMGDTEPSIGYGVFTPLVECDGDLGFSMPEDGLELIWSAPE